MNGFEQRAAKIKQKIMDTTLSLMQHEALKKIKIADIATQAEVSQVTIYNYFGSKDTLIRESYKNYMLNTLSEFEQYGAEGHSFREIVEYTLFAQHKAQSLMASGLIEELMRKDEELYRFIEGEYQTKAFPLLIKLLEEGKRSGEVSPTLTAPIFLVYLQMFMSGIRQVMEAMMQSDDTEQFTKELTHLFFYGLCGKETEAGSVQGSAQESSRGSAQESIRGNIQGSAQGNTKS